MMYVNFTAGNKDYKLRLNTRGIVALEKQLGCNPLAIFGPDGERMPPMTEMVAILHASLQQLNHGVSMDDAYTIFDEWLDDGHVMTDFLGVIVEIYQESGIIKKDRAEDAEKNA